MKKICGGILCGALLLVLGSCSSSTGSMKGSGLPAGQVTAKAHIDKSKNQVWIASSKVINQLGLITREDSTEGRMEANIRDAKVIVMVNPLTPHSVRIGVNAHKNQLPDRNLAAEIITKIQERLKSS